MLTIFLRTLIVYVILIGTMRLMGKRQLGELEISDLVTTLFLSELASLPIEDPTIPIMFVIIPLATILALEVSLSLILTKCPRLKNIASARPSVLIRRGKTDQKEMQRSRISIDELISEVRQAGHASLAEVDYAILEQNGKISVIPRKSEQPPTAKDLGLNPSESGILHILISNGQINRYNVRSLGLAEGFIDARLAEKKTRPEDVFLLGMDDSGKLYWIEKEENA